MPVRTSMKVLLAALVVGAFGMGPAGAQPRLNTGNASAGNGSRNVCAPHAMR